VYHKGKRKGLTLHRLVADLFIPNPDNLPYVCHKDDDKMNPHKDNLFRGTAKDNTQDMIKKGRRGKTARNAFKVEVLTITGQSMQFDALSEACEYFKLPYQTIRAKLANSSSAHFKVYTLRKVL